MSNPTTKQPRNSNLEGLRIFSMFLIVLGHFIFYTNWDFQQTDLWLRTAIQWLWAGGKLGVNLFILISAYFLSQSTRQSPNWASLGKLWLQVWFYAVVLFGFGVGILHLPWHGKNLLQALFPLTTGAYWFVTAYFGLVILAPVINFAVQRLDFKHYSYLLLFLLALTFIECTTGNHALGLTNDNIPTLIITYLVGGYLQRFPHFWQKISNKQLYLIIASCLLLLYLSTLSINLLESWRQQSGVRSSVVWRYYVSSSPFQLINAAAIFLLVLRRPPKQRQSINYLAHGVFGVYLIHDNLLLSPWLWNHLINAGAQKCSLWIFPQALLVAASILIVGLICDNFRQVLFQAGAVLVRKIKAPHQQ
ncbi:acyltransferase [Lactobacillus sp. DCY120]|uniref:Acyltransferase n=1 Tax=Bombilactobacillus apium TaxID=2675299 RepID=A0A850R0Y8_9LACO|nr:acyltransferase [Bombilactobacillus apium]NVY96583.1 acyltransferase [Bombilactobacillus apium]